MEGASPDVSSEELEPTVKIFETSPSLKKSSKNPFDSLPNGNFLGTSVYFSELVEYIFSFIYVHAPVSLSCKRFHKLLEVERANDFLMSRKSLLIFHLESCLHVL